MAWPGSVGFVLTNLDAGADSPASARADLKDMGDDVSDMIGARGAASGVASLDAGSLIPTAQLGASASAAKYYRGDRTWAIPNWSELAGTPTTVTGYGLSFGTTAGTICQGNDARLSDARTPTSHNHAASEITSGTLALARGGTAADLSSSGGATHVLAQDGSHVITARALIAADIPNLDASKITTGTIESAFLPPTPLLLACGHVGSTCTGSGDQVAYTYAVPGDLLGSANGLRVVFYGRRTTGSGNIAIKLKYGGTTIASFTAGGSGYRCEAFLWADGSAGAQRGFAFASTGATTHNVQNGTSSIDSTTNQNLTIEVDFATDSDVLTTDFVSVELLPVV